MNRRSFLTSLMASGVVAVASSTGLARYVLEVAKQRLCILYGDGAHDDTAAFQALVDGVAVEHNGRPIGLPIDGKIEVPEQGHYVIYDQITVPNYDFPIYVQNSTLEAPKGFRGKYMMYFSQYPKRGKVSNLSFFGTVTDQVNAAAGFRNVSVS